METATIPVTVTEEAAARVAKLGMHREFEQILEHTKQTVTHLRRIEVALNEVPWLRDHPLVLLTAWRSQWDGENDRTDWNWIRWFAETFSSEVCDNFGMDTLYEPNDAR
jgi:hypothetical protein